MTLYIHISNPQQWRTLPKDWNGKENWGLNASPEEILAAGFRPGERAASLEGERIVTSHVEWDATHAWEVIDSTANLADEASAAAQAEIERRATPLPFDQPIECPILALLTQTDLSRGVGLVVYQDEDGYHTALYEQHASPNPSAAEQKRRVEAAITVDKAARKAAKDELAAIKTKLDKAEADIVDIKAKVK